MQRADLAIPDSGLMVLLWRLQRREKILRVSGLNYLRQLLAKLKGEGSTLLSRAAVRILRSDECRDFLQIGKSCFGIDYCAVHWAIRARTSAAE
jgi:hypothetical protein